MQKVWLNLRSRFTEMEHGTQHPRGHGSFKRVDRVWEPAATPWTSSRLFSLEQWLQFTASGGGKYVAKVAEESYHLHLVLHSVVYRQQSQHFPCFVHLIRIRYQSLEPITQCLMVLKCLLFYDRQTMHGNQGGAGRYNRSWPFFSSINP